MIPPGFESFAHLIKEIKLHVNLKIRSFIIEDIMFWVSWIDLREGYMKYLA